MTLTVLLFAKLRDAAGAEAIPHYEHGMVQEFAVTDAATATTGA